MLSQSSQFITLASVFFAVVASVARSDKVCLLKPFVSSIIDVSVTLQTNSNSKRIDMKFMLNYEKIITLENFILHDLASDKMQVDNSNLVTLVFNNNPADVIYSSDKMINSTGKYYIVHHTKSNYLHELSQISRGTKENALSRAETCSSIYIYDADFYAPINKTHYIHIRYHKSIRCWAVTHQDQPRASGLYQYVKQADAPFYSFSDNVASAFCELPYLFEINTDSYLNVFKFVENHYPNPANPLGNGLVLILGGFLAPAPPPFGAQSLITEPNCTQKIISLSASGQKANVKEYSMARPFRTFTRVDSLAWLAVESSIFKGREDLYIYWRQTATNGPFELLYPSKIYPPPFHDRNLQLQAASVAFDREGVDRIELIQLSPTINSILYRKIDRKGGVVWSFGSYTIPDDITHWAPCKKIVSVYGFMYTLHEYNESIIEHESEWHILDDKLFDHPIEAMHAEGDEFWFFTKVSTVRVMQADSSNCSRLKFTMKGEVQVTQLFDKNAQLFNVEGRYFDGSRWIPQWDYKPPTKGILNPINYPTGNSIKPNTEKSNLWAYILGGLIIALIVVTVLVVFVFIVGNSASSHHVIHSKHGSVRSGELVLTKSATLLRSQPLLSQFHKTIKTLDSRGSPRGGGRRRRGQAHKSERKSSPKKQKSPKKSIKPKSQG